MGSTDLSSMDPREFVRGLMRGHKPDFKLGYDFKNAVLAVCKTQHITDTDKIADLLAYAEGFGAGMKCEDYPPGVVTAAYHDGYYDGEDEPADKVNPA